MSSNIGLQGQKEKQQQKEGPMHIQATPCDPESFLALASWLQQQLHFQVW